MSTHAHARRGRLGRFADLFRHDPARPPRPVINVGMPGFEVPMLHMPDPAPGKPAWKRAEPAAPEPATVTLDMPQGVSAAPWERCDIPTGDTPHSERQDPLQYEYQQWYGWGTTLLDNRAPMPRRYAPEPHTPDLCADLAELEIFRETLGTRTRRHPAGCACGHPVECLCGHPVTGDTWAERLVRVGIHLLADGGAAA